MGQANQSASAELTLVSGQVVTRASGPWQSTAPQISLQFKLNALNILIQSDETQNSRLWHSTDSQICLHLPLNAFSCNTI